MPAQVSSEEVALAKGDGGVEAVHAGREVKRVNAENWKALPAWNNICRSRLAEICRANFGCTFSISRSSLWALFDFQARGEA